MNYPHFNTDLIQPKSAVFESMIYGDNSTPPRLFYNFTIYLEPFAADAAGFDDLDGVGIIHTQIDLGHIDIIQPDWRILEGRYEFEENTDQFCRCSVFLDHFHVPVDVRALALSNREGDTYSIECDLRVLLEQYYDFRNAEVSLSSKARFTGLWTYRRCIEEYRRTESVEAYVSRFIDSSTYGALRISEDFVECDPVV